MKKYISLRALSTLSATLLVVTAMVFVSSCADNEMPKPQQNNNFVMNFETRSPSVPEIVQNLQLYAFNNDGGSANDKKFHSKILNLTRTTDQVSAQVQAGNWHMAMVAPGAGTTLIQPTSADVMSNIPMYKYEPAFNNTTNRHEDADEMLFTNMPVAIVANQNQTATAHMNRNAAMVRLILKKTTANFETAAGTDHKLILNNIPSTITWTGGLYPSKESPALVSGGIQARPTLKRNDPDDGFLYADPIEFIIPAHRGDAYTANPPTQLTTKKMKLTVDLVRTGGGSHFLKEDIEIDKVAICNHILEVHITVNDGVLFETNIKKWEAVDIGGTVGAEYQNWLYVKKNATGSGASWSDAAPDIKVAIDRAIALKAAGKTVHGILVAAGANESEFYDMSQVTAIPEGLRIFGGWSAAANSELGANDVTGPYTSTERRLTNKPLLSLGANSINLANANTVLDGFKVRGAGNGAGLLSVSNSSAWVNAIEIDNEGSISANYALAVSNGVATNVLVSRNNKGVSVTGSGKLINATVTENSGTSTINSGTVYNTIFWPSNPDISGTYDIQYSAFIGTKDNMPSGTNNIHVNIANTAWFSGSIVAPGPHFKLTTDSERYYASGNRAPMLGRGNEALYTTTIGQTLDKDINGNKRYDIDPQDNSKMLMDIGCYEDVSSLTGFRLTWASERLYLSAKGGYTANLPLMLPGNAEPETEIDVTCTVTANPLAGATTWSTYQGFTLSSASEKVVVGTLKFKNYGETPDNDYKTTGERQWGTIDITTNLGGYLPNTTVQVWQMSGSKATWVNGYVGSFHRNGERGARYISGTNPGGSTTYWEARIISGLDWIKIDNKGKNEGTNITDSQEGRTPSGGYYKEVEEIWGGVIKASAETRGKPIRFRVGMKSKNSGKPRYGLIVITYGTSLNVDGNISNGSTIMFFVRQGEEPDIVYTASDSRRIGGVNKGRLDKYLTPFTVYNLTAPAGTTNANNGVELSNKATFVKYPTQIGYYFRFNTTRGYAHGSTTAMNSTARTSYSSSYEICPTGYRHPAQEEYMYTIYDRAEVNETVANRRIEPGTEESKNNYMLGAYADGYYDQLASDPVATSNQAPTSFLYNGVTSANAVNESTPGAKGILMVSHFNYASIFFPVSGTLSTSGSMNNGTYAMYAAWLDIPSGFAQYYYRNTHWDSGHIGMNCTGISNRPAPVRCVKATTLP